MTHAANMEHGKADASLSWKHWFEDRVTATLLTVTRPLPYRWRIEVLGWLGAYVLGPLAGLPPRIRTNLALVRPDLPEAEVRRLCRDVPRNVARAMAETFSGDAFIARVKDSPISGDGLAALDAARDAGRPVVLVTAHLGSYDAARVVLRARGCEIAGVYMPMRNRAFNRRYVAAMAHIAAPVFPRNKVGLVGLMRHLRKGGMIGLVADHYMSKGRLIDFMGQPARTSTGAAEMALKHDALLVPVYGLRADTPTGFRVLVEAPIPHSDPVTMTRALNASLEALVEAHMDQWMWAHLRWKKNKPRPGE